MAKSGAVQRQSFLEISVELMNIVPIDLLETVLGKEAEISGSLLLGLR